ncbi:MAG: hypothetical protein QOD69_2947, partial [Solirubrobacteraceae bacterium]|nr:hypothetical protein [Solirubrobacteraceae bacterium]
MAEHVDPKPVVPLDIAEAIGGPL